jgi:dTDP-4-dehydrorhamnose reductase
MRALILGAYGQLGRALQVATPADVEVWAYGADTLDITDGDAIEACLSELRPDIVVNAAAYTAVDKAESDAETARAVNATAVGTLAEGARRVGARFAHVSTDFVFDGTAGVPYSPDAEPSPLGVYGRTKLEGERLAGPDALIVRTAWVYAPTGENFVRTMLRLMLERSEVRVVADQIGTPTYAPSLAAALWALLGKDVTGIYHYTDSGVASWYDFAVAIHEEARAIGLLTRTIPVIPIATVDFPTAARRPPYSLLDKQSTVAALGAPPPHWRANLRLMLRDIKTHG